MKAVWRVYIRPFAEDGAYSDWVEVTNDVLSNGVGAINTDLDNTDYDIGVYRNSNFNIKLRNDHGFYSDVGSSQTIFRYSRSNSMVKITHQLEADDGPACGFAICGESYFSEETEVFKGIINDESLSMDLGQQDVSFVCLGRESLFLKTVVPFGSVHNGDLVSETIYALLNQSVITNLLNLDISNINPGSDLAIDSIAGLQNKTVQSGLNELLLLSNSVLWIDGDNIMVTPRDATADVKFNFYGQASADGAENIIDIKGVKSGLSRVFNYISWKDVATAAQEAISISRYGVRSKELQSDLFTDAGKISTILTAIKNEFAYPKQEFDLVVPFGTDTVALKLLDRISIDYPDVAVSGDDPLPIFGSAVAGQAVAPKVLWSFSVNAVDTYKIIGRSIDAMAQTIKFRVRRI